MNITPNFETLKLPAIVQQRQNSQRVFLANNNQDTFVHSTPTFKGGIQKVAADILNDPKKSAGLAAFLTAGFAALVRMATGDNKEDNTPVENAAEELTAKYVEKTAKQENENSDSVKILFPKKIGRLSAAESNLKTYVEQLTLNDEYAQKITNICEKLLVKYEFYEIGDETLNTAKITPKFYNELVDAKDDENATKEIIDKYSAYLETRAANTSENLANNTETTENVTETAKNNIEAKQTTSKNNPPRKIELPSGEDYPRLARPTIITEQTDGKTTYKLTIPGTISNTQWALGTLFKNVSNKIKESNPGNKAPYFTQKASVIKATNIDVINEIVKRRRKGNPYIHIKEENAAEIADVLSSGKFANLFSLHSSMRFIDKFVKFGDNEKPIEEQCDILIEKLNTAIQKTLQKGANIQILEQRQKQKFGSKEEKISYVPTFIIEPEKLDKDIQDALGTLPIKIIFCRVFHPAIDQKGLICTIFPLDVDYNLEDEM